MYIADERICFGFVITLCVVEWRRLLWRRCHKKWWNWFFIPNLF